MRVVYHSSAKQDKLNAAVASRVLDSSGMEKKWRQIAEDYAKRYVRVHFPLCHP